jgi:hypothetical protein
MPVSVRNNVITLEQAAPHRPLPQFAAGLSPDAHRAGPAAHRRTVLGLPSRAPLFSPGDTIAATSHDRLDAA